MLFHFLAAPLLLNAPLSIPHGMHMIFGGSVMEAQLLNAADNQNSTNPPADQTTQVLDGHSRGGRIEGVLEGGKIVSLRDSMIQLLDHIPAWLPPRLEEVTRVFQERFDVRTVLRARVRVRLFLIFESAASRGNLDHLLGFEIRGYFPSSLETNLFQGLEAPFQLLDYQGNSLKVDRPRCQSALEALSAVR